jgi:hypothetical protein
MRAVTWPSIDNAIAWMLWNNHRACAAVRAVLVPR